MKKGSICSEFMLRNLKAHDKNDEVLKQIDT